MKIICTRSRTIPISSINSFSTVDATDIEEQTKPEENENIIALEFDKELFLEVIF